MPIPEDEVHERVILTAEAYVMAFEGQFVRGYDHLAGGLATAEARYHRADPRARQMMRDWEREIERYCQIFGVELSAPELS